MKRIVTGVAPVLAVSASLCMKCTNQITCGDYNITAGWVDKIALPASTLGNVERVAVKMERMNAKTSNVDLNDGILGIDDICILRRVKVTCISRSAQDLEESWKNWRNVCDVVDCHRKARSIERIAK